MRPIIRFTIPAVPPSVNHYKKPIRLPGGVTSFALTPEAEAWIQLTAIYRQGQSLLPVEYIIWTPQQRRKWSKDVRYVLRVRVVLGAKQRGDGDNFWKCIADSLVKVGIIHSDAAVTRWILDVDPDDRGNPRTEITAAIRRVPSGRATAGK